MVASRRQFGLRGLLCWITLLCVVLAVAALKVNQDRRRADAMFQLQRMGFQVKIGSANSRPAMWLRYNKPAFMDSDLERLESYMERLSRRYDLGISSGLDIRLVDFTSSRVSNRVFEELEAKFPSVEVRR